MGDPALDDNADDDEFFSPEAFKPRAANDDEFNAPEAFKQREQAKEPAFIHYQAPKPEPDALKMFLESNRDGVPGVDENITPEGASAVGGMLNTYAGGLDGKLDQRLPLVGDAIKDSRAQFAQEHPGLAAGADMAGAVASPINVAGKEKALANIVGQAAGGGMQGAARAFGDAGGKSAEDQLMDTFAGGKGGAELGGAVATGGHALGGVSDWVGDKAGVLGNYLRRAAMGVTEGDVKNLVNDKGTAEGLAYAKNELGRLPDKLGIANRIRPNNAADYANKAVEARKAGGAMEGAGLDRAASEVPSIEIDKAKDSLLDQFAQLADHDRTVASGSKGTASHFDDMTGRLQSATPSTPRDLHDLKMGYESLADAPGAVPGSQESAKAIANNAAGNSAREQLRGVMGQASPEANQMFQQGAQQYGDAATVEDITKRAAAKGMVAPLMGAGLGGYAGYQARHDLEDAGFGAVAGGLAVRGAQNYGADLGANVARPVEALGHGANSMLQTAAQHGGQIAVAKQSMDESRGHELPSVINKLLQDPQQAQMLGRWRAEFEAAGRTPGGIAGLLNKLDRDREWKTTKLPELQQMTGDRQ